MAVRVKFTDAEAEAVATHCDTEGALVDDGLLLSAGAKLRRALEPEAPRPVPVMAGQMEIVHHG